MLRFSTVLLSGILAASINTAIPGIELPDPFASPGEVLRIYGYDRTAEKLLDEGRANYMSSTDYTAGGDMESLVRLVLDHISADAKLSDLEGVSR